jgi:translation initiation factor IF-1
MAKALEKRGGMRGTIVESLPNDLFRVRLDDQNTLLAHVGTRSGNDFLRLLPGDRVEVEPSANDRRRGRITERCKT